MVATPVQTPRRSAQRRAVADIAIGSVEVAAALIAAPLLRRRYNTWGATAAEASGSLPGDELVAHPQLGYTRAVTIDVPPDAVWPWLVQMGQGRGGLYSFDDLENVARCDIHSADRIMAEHQELHAGDLIRLGPEGYPCFRVAQVEAPDTLVLTAADPKPPHDSAAGAGGAGATWQWSLRPLDAGTRTRLLVRQRLTYPRTQHVLWHVVEPIAFVMERQMLLGIKWRAEAAHRAQP